MSERPSRWGDVPPHWRTCVELAWAAYGRDTTPVGAIVVDGQGREVGRGVNARYADPDAQLPLAGSHLAHAELVAVSGLGSHARYPDHTLYSTLEPCLLCVGAAVMAAVGCVRWAGIDPYGGATSVVAGQNAHLGRRLTRFVGPVDGPLGTFCAALHVAFYLHRNPNGAVVSAYRSSAPALVEAARQLVAGGAAEAASGGRDPGAIFDRLAAVYQ